ncbi:MAG: 2-C-methyl-D-erythritol 2,4-cyclodiphosphate synthase [Clostridiales bacterium]|nr:2-C-methyl-D-erythritol 2,4-cyclodiphosphate synthase [Clostridiales bacterium]
MRIGNGYDVHKLVENRELIIGGVLIPYEKGLLGHSDADVLVHAIIDSLLGATKKGDIGKLFPDNDNRFKDICSLELLKKVYNILKKDGYEIINIDSIIIAQAPKMRPYIDKMEETIATCLNIDKSQINVKATTEEGLGFTGALEGISANAVCLVIKK